MNCCSLLSFFSIHFLVGLVFLLKTLSWVELLSISSAPGKRVEMIKEESGSSGKRIRVKSGVMDAEDVGWWLYVFVAVIMKENYKRTLWLVKSSTNRSAERKRDKETRWEKDWMRDYVSICFVKARKKWRTASILE